MANDLSAVHINRALSSMSIMLNNDIDTFLFGRVCARRPVDNMSDLFFQYGREGMSHSQTAGQSNVRFLPNVTNPGGVAPIVDQTESTGSYRCRRYSLRDFVSDREIGLADSPLNPLKDAGIMLRNRLLNDAEGVVANIVATYGNYPAGNRTQLTTGGSGTTWNSDTAGSASDPLKVIRTGRQALQKSIQMRPNTLAMSASTKYHLDDHVQFKNILQYTDEGYLEGEGIPEHIRGLRLAVGEAVWNTAADGAAVAGDYIFADQSEATAANQACAIICYVPPEKTIGPRGFASFIWFDHPDETTNERGVSLRAYREESRRGWYIEGAITFDVQPGIVDSNSKITGAYMVSRATIP